MNASKLIEIEVRPGVRLSSGPAVYLEKLRAVVVADVHWGYAISQRAAGRLVPRWGDDDIAVRLDALLEHYAPRMLIIAGDVVHGAPGADAAHGFLDRVSRDVRVVLISGNHDRCAALSCVASHHEADTFIHHGDETLPVPAGALEIVGHHHPAAAWHDGAGTALKLPALVEGPQRLILPAFSPWASGVAWNHRLRARERLWAITPRRIFAWRG